MIVSALLGYALLSAATPFRSSFSSPRSSMRSSRSTSIHWCREFLMRFLCWLLVHTVYRVKKSGIDRIPDEGRRSSSATTSASSTR
jgi:1-acyl-sn-glycerol-3-phosphate acyltransferase